jgi:hypothetical protein
MLSKAKVNKRAVVIAACGVSITAVVGWGLRWYLRERSSIESAITQYRSGLANREDELSRAVEAKRALQTVAATTLGQSEEETSAALRSVLNQIYAYHGLTKPSVSTRAAVPVRNLAVAARPDVLRSKAFAESIDYYTVTAVASGEGSLESVLRALTTVQGQPWARRIESVTIKPEGKERERASISLSVTTFVLPDVPPPVRIPGEDAPPLWLPLGDDSEAWREIATRDPFREPRPPAPPDPPSSTVVAQADPVPPPPLRPPRPAYEQWRVTGMSATPLANELWLVCEPTGEWRRLTPGESVLDAQLVRVQGDSAWIRIGDNEFIVTLGTTLADRKPSVQ